MISRKKRKIYTFPFKDLPLSTPIEEIMFIVFDTETTGFRIGSEDRLIEIAAVPMKMTKVLENDMFHSYVNPKRHISREIIELTGISLEKVENAPLMEETVINFLNFSEKYEPACLVGHYVAFDLLVLKSELKRCGVGLKGLKALDTLDLIGLVAPSFDMRDLERYAQNFGTRIYQRHTANGDTLMTAYLFQELLLRLRDRRIGCWGDLLSLLIRS